jgi:Flp pilus assembly protein CpaB
VGVLLALLAFGLVFVVAGALSSGRAGPGGPSVKVVVAARDIPLRAILQKEDLVLQDFATTDVPPQSYSQTKDATGLIAELNIAKGQALTQNMLAKSADGGFSGIQPAYLPIAQGFVALTIPTSEQQGVAGYIQAGDYINVIATVGVTVIDPKQTQTRNVNKTVFTNLHVLRTGVATGQVQSASNGSSSSQQGSATGAGASSLTVVMTQCDAEFMNWFLNSASLKYTISSYHDYQPQDVKADPTCPNATSTKGVGPHDVDNRWHFTALT